MLVPTHAGLFVLAGLAVVGIVLAVIGFAALARAGLALKKRLEGYGDLPLRVDIELARRRIALAERRIDTLPVLIMRVDNAYRQILAARARVSAMAGTVVRVIRRPARRQQRL